MSYEPPERFVPCPRPIAELPAETLLAGEHDLARRWALALIDAHPLAAIAELPLDALAREAPALCGHVIRAVQSDAELERLTGRPLGSEGGLAAPASRLAAIAGARDPAAVVLAAEALRGVLWEALREQLGRNAGARPSPWLMADACDRLAYVCAAMLAASIACEIASEPAPAAACVGRDAPAGPVRDAVIVGGDAPAGPVGDAVIVDERTSEHVPPAAGAIEIRDQRREEGPAAWIRSIGAQLERFELDERPFAVLLVELADIERLRREAPAEELARLAAQVEQALAATLGELSGSLTRERPGRCWVLAPDTDTAGAALLEHHITRAVAAGASHRGEPVAVVVGTAVCPRDGREASALAAHADVGLYAARAALRTSVQP